MFVSTHGHHYQKKSTAELKMDMSSDDRLLRFRPQRQWCLWQSASQKGFSITILVQNPKIPRKSMKASPDLLPRISPPLPRDKV